MGNVPSSPSVSTTEIIKDEVDVVVVEEDEDEDLIPGTTTASSANSNSSNSGGVSVTSYTSSSSYYYDDNYYDCSSPAEESSDAVLEAITTTATSRSIDECFLRLPLFQKRKDLLRILDYDDGNDDHYYNDSDVSPTNSEEEEQQQRCWEYQTATNSRRIQQCEEEGNNISSGRGSSIHTSSDRIKMYVAAGEEKKTSEYDDTEDDDDDKNDYGDMSSCSQAYYRLYSSKKLSSTISTTTSTTTAQPQTTSTTASSYYYDCYNRSTTSTSSLATSFSKCASSTMMDDSWTTTGGGGGGGGGYTQDELDMIDGDEPTDASDLQSVREYWIVTTAALPWMTGTAVNPLLRAAYLSQRNRMLLLEKQQQQESNSDDGSDDDDDQESKTSVPSTVTLVLPWLEDPEDREKLYGSAWAAVEKTPYDQEVYIRQWLSTSANMPLEAADPSDGGITIQWYPAKYHTTMSSIFALGDLCEMIPSDNPNLICILEEPEHVNFYRAPGRESWRDKACHVIGVIHTNYKAYARNHYSGILTGPLVGALSSLMVRAYCDKVVKLSPVLQIYAPGKETVSNVHGIRQEFFEVPLTTNKTYTGARCYFIGKLLWGKSNSILYVGFYFEEDVVLTISKCFVLFQL